MIIYLGVLKVQPGKRREYIDALQKANLEELFRKHRGNIFYFLAASITDENIIVACDAWEEKADFEAHISSKECEAWFALHDKYVEEDLRSDTYEL